MIAILPAIILIIRMAKFLGLSREQLSHLSDKEFKQMRSSTKTSVWVIGATTVLSFLPFGFAINDASSTQVAQYWALGITLVGLIIASLFDLKAERIKRRGLGISSVPLGTVKWYHFLFIIFFPYFSIFWGVFNLTTGRKRSGQVLIVGSLIMMLVVFASIYLLAISHRAHAKSLSNASPLIAITHRPSALPTTAPLLVKPQITSYIDVVRSENPAVPATQPLVLPVDLPDAAHLVLHDPVYLDQSGHLWITRADAKPTELVLQKPTDPTEYVIPERPVFVHWALGNNADWSAEVVIHRSGGGLDIVSSVERRPLANDRPYRWDCAFSWDGKIVVPTDIGVSVFDVEPKVIEHYHALPGATTSGNPPLVILDARGLLAWSPWENNRTGSHGVSRFVDGQWTDLSSDLWPDKIIQLLPLLDGSILQIIAGDDDQVTLGIAPLESTYIDQKHVAELVDNLADPDPDKRQAAFTELSQYGPGLWPILEKMSEDQPAEARVRIKQLLRSKISPALGGMTLIDNRLSTVHRQSDGVAIFFAPAGVKIPNGDQEAQIATPAWVCIRPGGRVDRALPIALVKDLRPDNCTLQVIHDEFVVCDDAGVRRFFGNGFVPLLSEQERQFHRLIGIDHRGRWLFGKAIASDVSPTAGPTTMPADQTLIIDPTILDPTPRLPVWTMTLAKGTVGWNVENYPVINRGGPWALKEDSWESLDPKTEIITELLPAPPFAGSASTQPTTAESLGPPLLITGDGMRFFDGRTMLVMISKDGKQTHWPLPPTAVGDADPVLLRTADGLLFLYNQPGRLLRIKPTPDQPEPFKLEATFTKDIPNTDHPTRIWLDPLGRIDFAYDGNSLAVMFPSGHIPSELARMMVEEK